MRIPLMMRDSAAPEEKREPERIFTLSEKKERVAKAYGEAAVRKIAEEGGKSDAYKEAYAAAAGDAFVRERDDQFIEGFFESLLSGKTIEETKKLMGDSRTIAQPGKPATRTLADGAVRVTFSDGSSVEHRAGPGGRVDHFYFDAGGYQAQSLTAEQLACADRLAGADPGASISALVDSEAHREIMIAQMSMAWR